MTYDTSRIRRMRQRMLARPAVCVERCAILTRSFQATEGRAPPSAGPGPLPTCWTR